MTLTLLDILAILAIHYVITWFWTYVRADQLWRRINPELQKIMRIRTH